MQLIALIGVFVEVIKQNVKDFGLHIQPHEYESRYSGRSNQTKR